MKRTRIPKTICPNCLYAMDAVTELTKGKKHNPQPGDFSVCLNCGCILTFNKDLSLSKPPAGALVGVSADTVKQLVNACALIKKRGQFKSPQTQRNN